MALSFWYLKISLLTFESDILTSCNCDRRVSGFFGVDVVGRTCVHWKKGYLFTLKVLKWHKVQDIV